ncbi:hypothetical protein GF322_05285 [Candidatus Dependentiae bacterium]|nr:hypothetical protein [Candidatus Dependentiae bacterium]
MSQNIYYVTNNDGKFKQVHEFIAKNNPQINLKQFKLDIEEIQSLDQKKIVIDKAHKAWNFVKKPFLLDDSAIYFEKYNNFPGTLSKFVALGIGFEGIKKLINKGDKAFFLLYMVYMDKQDSISMFEGKCEGSLIKPRKFSGHINLPYSCFFIPKGTNKTYTQLQKMPQADKYLYRLKALKKFLKWYKIKI